MKNTHMISLLIRALMCWACMFCSGQAWATTCNVSAKITQVQGGPSVSTLKVTSARGTITNHFLEINIDTYVGNQSSDATLGDFCSITYAKLSQTHWGNITTQIPSWNVQYGTAVASYSQGCRSSESSYIAPLPNKASAFIDGWRLFDGTGYQSTPTNAAVFWIQTGTITTACTGAKVYIPITINYDLGPNGSMWIDSQKLFNNVAFCCNNGSLGSYSATGTNVQILRIKGSCSVSAPTLNLGTYNTNSIHTNGILGGVLKSTNITLTCNDVRDGANITPIVTISDAGSPTNTTCDPVNIATTPALAYIALFNSSTINYGYSYRYCVTPSPHAPNTIRFPDITTSTYTQSMPIYAGIFSASNPVKRAGGLLSILQLTVSYQ